MIKKKLRQIVNILFKDEENNNNIFFINSYKKLKKKINKNSIFIIYGKNILYNLFYIFFYLIFNKVKFKKNFFLLFKFNNSLKGHNFLPDWPGIYQSQTLKENSILWIKKFLYIFFYKRNLFTIVIKLN